MFTGVNERVGNIAVQIGKTPQDWNGGIFDMIHKLSDTVILPIAGVLLTFVMTLELVQLLMDKNSFHEVDGSVIFKWMIKTACAILLVSNTWDMIMGIFDLTQLAVSRASGVIVRDTAIDLPALLPDLEARLSAMELGPLFGLWFQSIFLEVTMGALSVCIFLISYGRMLEIYLASSLAPIPMAAMLGREGGGMGQNYLRSLFALGFQAFLIMVCVAVYGVLVQNISVSGDIGGAVWSCVGYTVLLCYSLFKTGTLAKGILGAH